MQSPVGPRCGEEVDSQKMSVEKLRFDNKVILAPMVRVGTLPMRLLALQYGADIVYSEEVIDYKMVKCRRVENSVWGTIDFVDESGDVVFRTCSKETEKLVFQIGTCDENRALRVAKFLEKDVAAFDVNMGCPKEFSIKGGMGAALLTQPDKVKRILTALVEGISKPITCKIRILPKLEDTLSLCRLIEGTGVGAIAVHGRTKTERRHDANHDDVIRAIAAEAKIPVVANGGSGSIRRYEDVETFKGTAGASSVMIARAAQWNCSVFRREGPLPLDAVIEDYIKIAIEYDNHPVNTKYCIQQMLQDLQETPRGKALLASVELRQICELWGLEGRYDERHASAAKASSVKRLRDLADDERYQKRLKDDEKAGICRVDVDFSRRNYDNLTLPKTVLHAWCVRKRHSNPKYETTTKDKLFQSVVYVDGGKYSPTCWQRNKKNSEQAAALASVTKLGISDKENALIK